jgi:ribosome-binding protein aMBF1 (putative translation factor)
MDFQIIKSPTGDEMVVLAKADFDALVRAAEDAAEDAADVAAYDAAVALNSDRLPPEVSKFITDGDSLLRALRRWRDLTQMQMSFKSEFSQGFISDLEAGRRKITSEVAEKLAVVLDVPADWLTSK